MAVYIVFDAWFATLTAYANLLAPLLQVSAIVEDAPSIYTLSQLLKLELLHIATPATEKYSMKFVFEAIRMLLLAANLQSTALLNAMVAVVVPVVTSITLAALLLPPQITI